MPAVAHDAEVTPHAGPARFEASDRDGSSVTIDRAYVDVHLNERVKDPN